MDNQIVISENQISAVVKPSTQELMKILANQSELELSLYEGNMNIQKAMEGTSLKKLNSIIEQKNLVKTIVYLTTRLASNFNVGKKFSDEQAIVMAMDLIEIFTHETIEDILLMFKYARTGKIGSSKEFKLDSQTVFHKWVPQYLELKAIARENLHNRAKDELTSLPKWEKENVAKFIVSDKKETQTTTPNKLGQRTKKNLEVPKQSSPIVNRKSYLKALEYQATLAPTANLKTTLAFFKEKNEIDAIQVIENELLKR